MASADEAQFRFVLENSDGEQFEVPFAGTHEDPELGERVFFVGAPARAPRRAARKGKSLLVLVVWRCASARGRAAWARPAQQRTRARTAKRERTAGGADARRGRQGAGRF